MEETADMIDSIEKIREHSVPFPPPGRSSFASTLPAPVMTTSNPRKESVPKSERAKTSVGVRHCHQRHNAGTRALAMADVGTTILML